MPRLALIMTLSVALAPAAWSQLDLQMDQAGVVTLSDGEALGRAVVSMHMPGWAGRTNQGASASSQQASTIRGAFELPADGTGSLDYSVAAKPAGDGFKLAYRVSFTDPNEIQGAYVSFLIPTSRFEAKTATVYPSKLSKALPREGEAIGLDGRASAVAIDLGEGESWLIAGNAAGELGIQDNRVYGSNEYELRFHLFGAGRVAPAMVATRTFHIARVRNSEVPQLTEAARPQRTLDPDKPYALVDSKGQVRIGTRSNAMVRVALAIHGLAWSYTSQADASAHASGDDRTRMFAGEMLVPGAEGQAMEFVQTATARENGALGLEYGLEFPRAVKLNGYQVSFSAELDDYVGTTIDLVTDDGHERLLVPAEHEDNFLYSGRVSRIAVAPGQPTGFTLDLDASTPLLVQDNRGWGGNTLELRFNFRRQEQGEEVPAGETVRREFTFGLNSPLQIVLDATSATDATDTSDWIAYTLPWDSAPVDVSFLNHKPAGKHGFVTAKDGKFTLSESGEEIRFWGTCFSAGANFPSHDQSEKIARRLARFGINMVRTHHADAPWAERHFFPKDVDNTRQFDAENLDRFDYLIHCLKREGIYIYLDQLVNRYFKPGDEVDAVGDLGACGKPYSNFDPRLIELQKEFSRNLWTHVNPYTGLAYKDDPAIALMEFANENDLFTQQVELEPYRTRFEEMYRAWADEKGIELPEGKINFRTKTDEMMRFLVDVQRDYYAQMESFLRDEVGVKAPMTGSNWSRNAALLAALQDMQYTDSHTYWQHPSSEGVFGNTAMVASRGTVFDGLGFQSVVGKPFFVSEWDEPWPNEWRAELPVWMAAIAAFQGWNGLTVYTYRHSSSVPIDRLSGAFETFNDPARFGLFAHCALIYRRGDVGEAREHVAVHIRRDVAIGAGSPSPWSAPAYRGLSEVRGLRTALFDRPRGYDRVVDIHETSDVADDLRTADTGQIRHSIQDRVVYIDSPRSQALIGYLGEAGKLKTADMIVDCDSLFATVALSSLTDAPIRNSNRLLLTAVGRAENTVFTYNLLRNRKTTDGVGPILIDPIRAAVSIQTTRRDLQVHAIGEDGGDLGEVPSSWAAGKLTFHTGPQSKTIYYRIASE